MKPLKIINAIIGGFISFLLLTGVIFKIMHWPGAGPLIVLGASSLSMYVILVAIGNIKSYEKKILIGICNGIGAFGGMLLAVGLLFKIMHWPGSGAMMLIAQVFVIPVIIFFAVLFIANKEPIKLSSGTFFSVICFGILIYGIAVDGGAKSTLDGIINSNRQVKEIISKVGGELDWRNAHVQGSKPIVQQGNKIHVHIMKLKAKLFEVTDALPPEIADTISIESIMGKDNYDVPTHILGIADPSHPIRVDGLEEFSAITLKEKIYDFNSNMKVLDPNFEPIKTNEKWNGNGMVLWEVDLFYHMSLAQVILSLNLIDAEALSKCNYSLLKSKSVPPNNTTDTIN